MKSVRVYYTRFGSTAKAAEALAEKLGVETRTPVTEKTTPRGILQGAGFGPPSACCRAGLYLTPVAVGSSLVG